MDTLYTALTHSLPSPPAEIASFLRRVGFTDSDRFWSMLQTCNRRITGFVTDFRSPDRLVEAMAASSDPERAFGNLYTLLLETNDTTAALIADLVAHHQEEAHALLMVCSSSQSLCSTLIQNPDFLNELFTGSSWKTLHSRDQLSDRLNSCVPKAISFEEALPLLRDYKKQEYLRIALADLTKQADTPTVLLRLSDVADLCLQRALDVCANHLERQHGKPLLDTSRESGFAVIGMGKLGGRELNFDSDIDLLFVYDSTDGRTSQSALSTYEYYPKLARMVTDLISRITDRGMVFRVDLRLRPEGRAGDIANSVDGYRWHYETSGQPWQRQALLKARPVAGSEQVGQQFLDAIWSYVFQPEPDPIILEDINRMREKIAHALVARGTGHNHVKLGPGGIREIEFIAQGFQLVHGGQKKWPWERSTLPALTWIADQGYLSSSEATDLKEAYLFYRDLENRIQMTAGRQAHEIPDDKQAQATLARMMGITAETRAEAATLLLSHYHAHTRRVQSIYDRVFHSTM